jgi:hypothetical protein
MESPTGMKGHQYCFTQRKEEAQNSQRYSSVLRALRKLSDLLCVNFFVFTKMTFRKKGGKPPFNISLCS